eukprot:2262369-Pleurochrysis_carterae.AAC.3
MDRHGIIYFVRREVLQYIQAASHTFQRPLHTTGCTKCRLACLLAYAAALLRAMFHLNRWTGVTRSPTGKVNSFDGCQEVMGCKKAPSTEVDTEGSRLRK